MCFQIMGAQNDLRQRQEELYKSILIAIDDSSLAAKTVDLAFANPLDA
jgi:hypothetical protein